MRYNTLNMTKTRLSIFLIYICNLPLSHPAAADALVYNGKEQIHSEQTFSESCSPLYWHRYASLAHRDLVPGLNKNNKLSNLKIKSHAFGYKTRKLWL